MNDPRLLLMSSFLVDYPFADRLYAGALDAIAHLSRLGLPVILSDGDVVFQPRKIQRSGLWDAVAGRVLIYIHKEKMLDAVAQAYPARHYVVVDDKLFRSEVFETEAAALEAYRSLGITLGTSSPAESVASGRNTQQHPPEDAS